MIYIEFIDSTGLNYIMFAHFFMFAHKKKNTK